MQRLFYYPGFVNNLGFIKSSNTFIIEGADGRDLKGATADFNQANLILPDRTSPGYSKLIQCRTNRSFIDAGGTSDIIGALFGTTTGVAQSATPFYVYAISNVAENEMTFFLSRQRGATISPVAGDIGDKTTPSVAITIDAFWAIASITEADYAQKPCIMIGSIEMSKDTSDDWTVSAITAEHGINRYPKIETGGGGLVVQQKRVNTTTYTTIDGTFTSSNRIPFDDTIPQQTEGLEIFTLAITPSNASNILLIEFNGIIGGDTNTTVSVALFKNSDANAISTISTFDIDEIDSVSMQYYMDAGTTSTITFKIRCGPASADDAYINGDSSSRKFGGTAFTSMVISEISV